MDVNWEKRVGNGERPVRTVHSAGWASDRWKDCPNCAELQTQLRFEKTDNRAAQTLLVCERSFRQEARQDALSLERLAFPEAYLGVLRRVRELRAVCTELDECIQTSRRCLAQVHEGEGSGEDQTTEPN